MKWLLLTLTLLISGCSNGGPEALLHDYAARVSNALKYDFSLKLHVDLPHYPAKRDRALELVEIREGLLDVLDLRHCGLLELIGQRNSSLGKLALPSQRLIYETRFLPQLRGCIHTLEQDGGMDTEDLALLERLRDIERIKRDNYSGVISNALFNSDEVTRHFTTASSAASFQPTTPISSLDSALLRFRHLSELATRDNWSTPDWIDQLETEYEAFYRSDFGIQWSRSLVLLTQTLDQTAHAIEARLNQRAICFNGKPNAQARIIRNVFNRYYAGQLQPWMSKLHRSGSLWYRHWNYLLDNLPATPEVRSYFNKLIGSQPDSLWQAYNEARHRHTQAWQRLLGQCGMMPGSAAEVE